MLSYYDYDPLNNLVKIVDPQGVVTLLQYNINNMLIYKDDPYMGVNQYSYNAFMSFYQRNMLMNKVCFIIEIL